MLILKDKKQDYWAPIATQNMLVSAALDFFDRHYDPD
jgi:hypothetical protein